MSRTILADSSANLAHGYTPESGASFASIPLTIRVDEQEFVDDKKLDVDEMIKAFEAYDGPARTACPSPEAWAKAFKEGGDEIIAVAMSSKLSGTYNSALIAKQMVEEEMPEKKIHVVDSEGTAGVEELIVKKIDELYKTDKPFEEIVEEVENFKDGTRTVFTLEKFDNLIKNGRMNKLIGKVASRLNIRVVGGGENGELVVYHKPRGSSRAYDKLLDEMGKKKNMEGADVIVSHTNNPEGAQVIAELIENNYPINSVIIKENGGLNSFYSEDNGIIVGF